MDRTSRAYLLCAMVALWFAGSELIGDATSIAYVAAWRARIAPRVAESRRFDAPALRGLVVFEGAGACKRQEYVYKVNAGLALLRPAVTAQSRVLVFDFTNPFSFALRLPSQRGDAAWWQSGTNIAPGAFPPADSVFQQVTMVMVPKCEEDTPTVAALTAAYGGYLRTHFQPRSENDAWTLLTRR
jgi:hypothetical protein